MMNMITRQLKRSLLLLLLISFATPVLTQQGSAAQVETPATTSEASEATAPADPAAAQYAMDWRITGPTGGDVRALVFDPNDTQRLYFGTLDGQIYSSQDGGHNWSLLVNFNRPKLFIDHIIVDPRNSQTIYVAAHRHKEPGGFFKTTDGGRTWRESRELREEALHSMAQSPSNMDVIYVGTNDGVYRSNDAGETWQHLPIVGMTNTNIESIAIDPRNAEVVYAGSWHLPFKSTDGGQTWIGLKNGIIDDSDVFAIDIDERNPDHIIASACSGIYDTRSGGAQWRKIQGIPSQSRRTRAITMHPTMDMIFAGTTEGFWRSTRGGADSSWMLTTTRMLEINSIAIHPSRPHDIFIGTNNYGVMVSHDDGRTFVPSNGGYSGRFANDILPDRELPNRIYASTINTATGGGFFFISNDGGQTWQPSMRNMPPQLITYSILQDEHDANIIYLGTNLGVYRSMDRGASWTSLGAPQPALVAHAPRGRRGRASATRSGVPGAASEAAAGQTVEMIRRAQAALNAAGYNVGTPDGRAGTQTIAALRRFQADKGVPVSGRFDNATLTALGLAGGVQTSTAFGELPTPPIFLADAVNALALTWDEQGRAGILAATNLGLYRSFDPTQGWQKLTYGSGLDPRTTAISTIHQNPKTIWVGTANSGLLVSRDGGATWQQVNSNPTTGVPTTAPVSAIAQDPNRSAYIYVGTKQSLYISHDGGERWFRRGGNLPYGDYASILINPRNGDEIFVGNAYQNGDNTGGVFRSSDAGMTWGRIDPSQPKQLPSQRIWALAFDTRTPDRLFVGSHSAGIYVAERGGNASLNVTR
ncbi:MAG: hypothetical protein AUG51_13555 [Acidobacteria bacterium 13_1_20CM_3_53_8]|nr:MAG: hypothetical protein AUG51_13555 [Acidobacteria bacterium 13_1_20CM_3_53_8]